MGDTTRANERVILSETEIDRALTRMTFEIIERNKGGENLILLGIPTRGVTLAHRLSQRFARLGESGKQLPVGQLDITMYRDDLRSLPPRTIGQTTIPPQGLDGAVVVIVDDVLYSGRTIRAALDAIKDIGRPRCVQLAVLVDRGHRELPIRADFVGKNLPTSRSERVSVALAEIEGDGPDQVTIWQGERR